MTLYLKLALEGYVGAAVLMAVVAPAGEGWKCLRMFLFVLPFCFPLLLLGAATLLSTGYVVRAYGRFVSWCFPQRHGWGWVASTSAQQLCVVWLFGHYSVNWLARFIRDTLE